MLSLSNRLQTVSQTTYTLSVQWESKTLNIMQLLSFWGKIASHEKVNLAHAEGKFCQCNLFITYVLMKWCRGLLRILLFEQCLSDTPGAIDFSSPWRIQELPDWWVGVWEVGGSCRQPQKCLYQPNILAIFFLKNCMKMKKIGLFSL